MKAVKIAGLLFLIASTSFAGDLGHGISYSIDEVQNTSSTSTNVSFNLKNNSKVKYVIIKLKVSAQTTSGSVVDNSVSAYHLKPNESTKTWAFLDGKNPTDIKVSLSEAYIEDKSLVGKTITAIKRQKLRWFGFSLQ
jgi:hypothetical protein